MHFVEAISVKHPENKDNDPKSGQSELAGGVVL